MNLANLNNRQALVLSEAAQIASLEMANLNNRQQANVLNAQAFLQMDLTNLSNEQQTRLFKSQSMIQSILSDAAAENASRQFNASSINQVNQFYDGLSTQVKQFNASQTNAMNQFNAEQFNSVNMFNSSQQNARDQFNAEFRKIIDQSNAEWRRNIALQNTAAINRANEFNATAALGLTTIEYNNLWQGYRDQLEYAWKTGENALDRENELARQVLAKQATIEAAKFQLEAEKYKALGSLAASVFDKSGLSMDVGNLLRNVTGAVSGAASTGINAIRNIFNTSQYVEISNNALPGDPAYGWTYYGDGNSNVTISPSGQYYYNNQLVYDQSITNLGGTLGEQGFTYY
jgi:cell wall-associated NlpC family hydrolase